MRTIYPLWKGNVIGSIKVRRVPSSKFSPISPAVTEDTGEGEREKNNLVQMICEWQSRESCGYVFTLIPLSQLDFGSSLQSPDCYFLCSGNPEIVRSGSWIEILGFGISSPPHYSCSERNIKSEILRPFCPLAASGWRRTASGGSKHAS